MKVNSIAQKFILFAFIPIILGLMTSCSFITIGSQEPIATVSISATHNNLDTPPSSVTSGIEPTIITTSTPSITPAHTITPSPTVTPSPTFLPITPVLPGTQIPAHGDVIQIKNIERITLLSRWGQGNPGSIVFTPDGKFFVVGTSSGLYLYDAVDYSLIHYINTYAPVSFVAISPDSQKLAAVVTGKLLLYQTYDWQLLLTIEVNANSVDFSPDNGILVLGENSHEPYIQLRDVATGEVIGNFKKGPAAWAVKISPQGNLIAAGGYSTTILALDGSILDQYGPYISGGSTDSVSFSPDGKFLAEGSDDFIRIWRVLENGRIINYRQLDPNQFDYPRIFDVVISPNGEMVAATFFEGIGVWDLSTGSRVFFTAANGYVYYKSLAWSMDSETIAVASEETGVDLWNIITGASFSLLTTNSGTFSSIAWSPDGQKLGVGAEEGKAYIYHVSDGAVSEQFGSGYKLNSLAFSHDNQSLAIGYGDRTAQFWNLNGTILDTLQGFGYGSSDVTFSSDGLLFAAILPESSETPPQVRFWNTHDWSVEKIFPVGDRDNFKITGFVLAPDQKTAAISYVDMRSHYIDLIKVISLEDGTTRSTLEPERMRFRPVIEAMAYTPDSSMLAVLVSEYADPNPRLLVWQTRDWSLLDEVIVETDLPLETSSNQHAVLTWSLDGSLVAVGAKDGKIHIFNSIDGEQVIILSGHSTGVTGVSFSPDGRILASLSLDGTLMLWGLR